jgi:argininosuccinate lyase
MEFLIGRGVPQRSAHEIIGSLVAAAMTSNIRSRTSCSSRLKHSTSGVIQSNARSRLLSWNRQPRLIDQSCSPD